jgi:hypothetical protein
MERFIRTSRYDVKGNIEWSQAAQCGRRECRSLSCQAEEGFYRESAEAAEKISSFDLRFLCVLRVLCAEFLCAFAFVCDE